MKSLRDIQLEFLDQRLRFNAAAEGRLALREARKERDALLQQAGIKDGPEDILADDADKWRDEDYYRLRVREMVFNVPDGGLRRQIMRAMDRYRSEQWEYNDRLSQFHATFVGELKQVRCSPPREIGIGIGASGGVVIMCLAYWFGGALDALVLGVGIVLPILVFCAAQHVTALWQHDVTYGEAIKIVEVEAAESKAEATRRLHLPKLFSNRENRTGEPDARTAGVSDTQASAHNHRDDSPY